MWRFHPAVWRGAWWAWRAVRRVRSDLRTVGVGAVALPAPALGTKAAPGVYGVLSRIEPTCLERALVAQEWCAAHGDRRDVIIGVAANGMRSEPAHAWLDGSGQAGLDNYIELHRLTPVDRTELRD